jgi:hypothetical protein
LQAKILLYFISAHLKRCEPVLFTLIIKEKNNPTKNALSCDKRRDGKIDYANSRCKTAFLTSAVRQNALSYLVAQALD